MELKKTVVVLLLSMIGHLGFGQADTTQYLSELKTAMQKQWPNNRTINLVFHGHSVPSGYFKTPHVNTLEAYPHLVLQLLKERYPTAVINSIVTAIGGENSAQGVRRMDTEVLPHQPDVLFIDYGLNDRGIGKEAAEVAMREMIEVALAQEIKVILLTPSPDISVDWNSPTGCLWEQRQLISALAEEYHVGLVDVFGLFLQAAKNGEDIATYMSQSNHPNGLGHRMITDGIVVFFN